MISNNPAALRILMNDELYLLEPRGRKMVVTEKTVMAESAENDASKHFDYLGENNAYTLVIVDYPTETYIDATGMEILEKILKAKNMDIRDIALLNINSIQSVSLEALKSFFACSKIVLFGISPQRIGAGQQPANQAVKYDHVNIMATYSLLEMNNDPAKKRLFWNVMKTF